MQTRFELRFRRFASAATIATTLGACGGTDQPTTATSPCTITFAASTDDAQIQAAIENPLRPPCTLSDPPLRASAAGAGAARADIHTSYELVRVERDEKSVRAVFRTTLETRLAQPGE